MSSPEKRETTICPWVTMIAPIRCIGNLFFVNWFCTIKIRMHFAATLLGWLFPMRSPRALRKRIRHQMRPERCSRTTGVLIREPVPVQILPLARRPHCLAVGSSAGCMCRHGRPTRPPSARTGRSYQPSAPTRMKMKILSGSSRMKIHIRHAPWGHYRPSRTHPTRRCCRRRAW